MISVNVLYPQKDGSTFDMSYYTSKHLPLVQKLLGSALKGWVVEKGLSGAAPGTAPAFSVLLALHFDSVDAFQKAFGPHAQEIQADIPNYSSESPIIQISEIKMS
jgi:uncharacterized protein (TIGR02118 family)